MKHTFVTAKIHRATVTGANLNYKGSVAICPELLRAAGIHLYELVHINNVTNGKHWETYVIKGLPHEVTLHGPPAHHFSAGDLVVVNRLVIAEPHEIPLLQHRVVYAGEGNTIARCETTSIATGELLDAQ